MAESGERRKVAKLNCLQHLVAGSKPFNVKPLRLGDKVGSQVTGTLGLFSKHLGLTVLGVCWAQVLAAACNRDR